MVLSQGEISVDLEFEKSPTCATLRGWEVYENLVGCHTGAFWH
jgi:hypothetical protein